MTLTLDPQLEAILNERAQQEGVSPETLAVKALWEKFVARTLPIVPQDDWERDLLSIGRNAGTALSNEALSSEGLYD